MREVVRAARKLSHKLFKRWPIYRPHTCIHAEVQEFDTQNPLSFCLSPVLSTYDFSSLVYRYTRCTRLIISVFFSIVLLLSVVFLFFFFSFRRQFARFRASVFSTLKRNREKEKKKTERREEKKENGNKANGSSVHRPPDSRPIFFFFEKLFKFFFTLSTWTMLRPVAIVREKWNRFFGVDSAFTWQVNVGISGKMISVWQRCAMESLAFQTEQCFDKWIYMFDLNNLEC